MSEAIVCPDCGHRNLPGATACEHCNFPLTGVATTSDAPRPARPEGARTASSDPAVSPGPASPASRSAASKGGGTFVPGEDEPAPEHVDPATAAEPQIVLRRPRRRQRRSDPQVLSLWLLFGAIAAASLVWLAIKVNVDRQQQPVAGAGEGQQKRADEARLILAKDSTNVSAQVALADVLYDTGNWSEAIVHYRAAIRRDSTRVSSLVDMGVCYFNLSDSDEAEHLFQLALVREPNQPIALFNLGIVNETRENYPAALQYFHRAIEAHPPADMQAALTEAVKRVQQKTGAKAPPLPK